MKEYYITIKEDTEYEKGNLVRVLIGEDIKKLEDYFKNSKVLGTMKYIDSRGLEEIANDFATKFPPDGMGGCGKGVEQIAYQASSKYFVINACISYFFDKE